MLSLEEVTAIFSEAALKYLKQHQRSGIVGLNADEENVRILMRAIGTGLQAVIDKRYEW